MPQTLTDLTYPVALTPVGIMLAVPVVDTEPRLVWIPNPVTLMIWETYVVTLPREAVPLVPVALTFATPEMDTDPADAVADTPEMDTVVVPYSVVFPSDTAPEMPVTETVTGT